MQKTENHKGCTLDARSHELRAGGYNAEVYIAQHQSRETIETQFVLKESYETYDTSETAPNAALQFGRHKVDVGFEPKFIVADAESE